MSESNLIEIEGEIKWFDPRKGYGFIVGPEGQDIFREQGVRYGPGKAANAGGAGGAGGGNATPK
mgnify:CR=1 FL=1